MKRFYIGTAAWTIPSPHKDLFPPEGSHLERYAQRLNAVEINTSFYREHKRATYERWAESVPEDFRFSVKLFKEFTHTKKLKLDAEAKQALKVNIDGILGLGEKLGGLLVQLPPSLGFEAPSASDFFASLRGLYEGEVFFEPRHKTWSSKAAVNVLNKHAISLVFADPEPVAGLNETAGMKSRLQYFRLHGSPEIYKSNYERESLQSYLQLMTGSSDQDVWCIFDNTTFGHATANALELKAMVEAEKPQRGKRSQPTTKVGVAQDGLNRS